MKINGLPVSIEYPDYCELDSFSGLDLTRIPKDANVLAALYSHHLLKTRCLIGLGTSLSTFLSMLKGWLKNLHLFRNLLPVSTRPVMGKGVMEKITVSPEEKTPEPLLSHDELVYLYTTGRFTAITRAFAVAQEWLYKNDAATNFILKIFSSCIDFWIVSWELCQRTIAASSKQLAWPCDGLTLTVENEKEVEEAFVINGVTDGSIMHSRNLALPPEQLFVAEGKCNSDRDSGEGQLWISLLTIFLHNPTNPVCGVVLRPNWSTFVLETENS